MSDIFRILRFGWPYLRRYWLRFALGIFFGFLFGASNGLTLGGVALMLNRLGDPAHVEQVTEKAKKEKAGKSSEESPALHTFHAVMKEVAADLDVVVDPWLPLAHRALDWKQILGGLLIFPVLAAFRGLMNYATSYLMAWSGQRIANDIKEDVFRKINSLSLDFFHKHTTAELMSRINDDTGALNTCLRLGLSDLVKEPSTIVSLFIFLLFLDWKLTLIALAFGPLCLFPTRIIGRKIKSQGRQDNVAYVRQAGVAMESFQNVRVTKAYDLGEAHARLFRQAGNRASHFVLKTVQARAMLNPIVETLNSFGIGAVFLYAIFANVSLSTLGAFLGTLIVFFTPFKKLSTIQVYFTQAGLAIERLMAIFQIQPSVREPTNPVPMAAFSRAIAFKNISFSYGDGQVLDDVTFTLPRGRRLGLAGGKRFRQKLPDQSPLSLLRSHGGAH